MNAQLLQYLLMASDAEQMLREEWPISQAEVAARFGRSQSWLSRLLKWYRRLDAEIAAQSTTDEGRITSDGGHDR
jgi:hypothetical protein